MKHIERRKLKVEDAFHDDIYKDIVRIHWQERGKRNRIGAIVRISVDGGTPSFFSLRGLSDKYKGEIRFDHVTRDELRLKIGDVHDFTIKETNPWQKLLWAVRATDPAAEDLLSGKHAARMSCTCRKHIANRGKIGKQQRKKTRSRYSAFGQTQPNT